MPPGCATNTSNMDTLRGWDDWSTISLPFRQFTDAADGTTNDPEPEDNPTDEELLAMDEQLNTTDVGVTITELPDPVAAGSDITYHLVVTNHGPNPAVSVQLVDVLPAQVSLISVDPVCRAAGRTISCGLGELVAHATRTIAITVHVPADLAHNAGGPVALVNHATIDNLTGPDPNQSNDSADEISTVTGAAPRWAYAYMDRATVNEAPIGVETPLNAGWQWSTAKNNPNTAGRRATVVHLGTGEYEVRLPEIGVAQGIAHVTAFRTVYRGRSCAVRGYQQSGPDELIRVGCVDQTGAPADWWFTVLFTAPASGTQPYATIRYQSPGAAVNIGPVTNAGTYNSAGRTNQVYHDSVGHYRAVLPGTPFAAGTGYIQVTQYGSGTAAHCHPYQRTPIGDSLEVSIVCYAVGSGTSAQLVDTNWLMSYADEVGLFDDAATPSAYASITGDPTNPVIDSARSYASNRENPTVERLGVGWYRVSWAGMGKYGGSVQLNVTSADGSYCHLGNINDYSAPPRIAVDVWCHNAAGVPADALFDLNYLRKP
jgi:uncharacterized repeat protein (TIGR01451 family)